MKSTATVQIFGKTRGNNRWAAMHADGEIQWGVGIQVFCVTAFSNRAAAVAKIQAWLAGGMLDTSEVV